MQKIQHEVKEGFEKQEVKMEERFKKNEEKMEEQFRKSEEKISETLREKDHIAAERDLLLIEYKKMAAELSFLREEITSLNKEVEKNAHCKQELSVVRQKYEKLCKDTARMPELDNENKTLKCKNAQINDEIKSLKDSLARLRSTVKARYATVSILPPIGKKKAE